MARKKINWLLILQGWAMLWVVIGHSPLKMDETMPVFAKALYDIAYSFHMPLFIFISGFLFYSTRLVLNKDKGIEWTYKAILIDKLKRLGIPFVVFTIIAMLAKTLFPNDMARPATFTIGEFIHAILFPREGPLLEMWFIAVIMWMFILTVVWRWCLNSNVWSFAFLIIMLTLHFIADYLPLGTFLALKDTAYLGVYFYLGMMMGKYGFHERCDSYKSVIITISILLYVVSRYVNLEFLAAMAGIIFSLSLAMILDKFMPKAFSSFRRYTYQIFLISIFVQIMVKMVYKSVALMTCDFNYPMLIYVLFFMICFIMGLYIPVLVSKIAERLNWAPILLTLGLNKK